MTTLFTPAQVRTALDLLAARSVVRLVTEIDDNGAIPPRRLAVTLPDLSTHQQRSATAAARTHGLVRTAPGAGLELTDAGTELADLYDALARWARHHAYPTATCDFSSRIRHVLDLLGPYLTAQDAEDSPQPPAPRLLGTEADLHRPRALLIEWLARNPQVTRDPDLEQAA